MITSGELGFVKDVFEDLRAISDPSDYLEGEVQEAINLLDQLSQYDLNQIVSIYQQLQELNNDTSKIE